MSMFRIASSALLLVVSVAGAAQGSNINGEATYVSFKVPGASGTYPMAVNASMTVTGYYTIGNSGNQEGGFIRTADGVIETFSLPGSTFTQPAAINAAGDVTGYYEVASGTQNSRTFGFLRYANGKIVTISAPDQGQGIVEPVGINAYNDIVATVYGGNTGNSTYAFTRSNAGVLRASIQLGAGTAAAAINSSGTVIGLFEPTDPSTTKDLSLAFLTHPDGYQEAFSIDSAMPSCAQTENVPEAINDAGTIAGMYVAYCPQFQAGGFVRTPEGAISLFQVHGTVSGSFMAINAVGDITAGYADSTGLHGFVRNPYGTVTTFDPPESDASHLTEPTGINDAGVITGYYAQRGAAGFLRIPYSGANSGQ